MCIEGNRHPGRGQCIGGTGLREEKALGGARNGGNTQLECRSFSRVTWEKEIVKPEGYATQESQRKANGHGKRIHAELGTLGEKRNLTANLLKNPQ